MDLPPPACVDEPTTKDCNVGRRQAVEEDVIDGFLISSFETFDDLESFVQSGNRKTPPSSIRHSSSAVAILDSRDAFFDDTSRGSTSSSISRRADKRRPKLAKVTSSHDIIIKSAGDDVGPPISPSSSTMELPPLDTRTPYLLEPPRSRSVSPNDSAMTVFSHSSVLRVPTPSSWEKLRVAGSSASSMATFDQLANELDVKVVVERTEAFSSETVADRKKHCSCGATDVDSTKSTALNTLTCQQQHSGQESLCGSGAAVSAATTLTINKTPTPPVLHQASSFSSCVPNAAAAVGCDTRSAVTSCSVPMTIKIEDSSPPPSFTYPVAEAAYPSPHHQARMLHASSGRHLDSPNTSLKSKSSIASSSRNPTITAADVTKHRGFGDPVKSRCGSPESVEVRGSGSESRSRSPKPQVNQHRSWQQSRQSVERRSVERHSVERRSVDRRSVEIKCERSSPSSVRKSSGHISTSGHFTPHHSQPCSSTLPPSSSFPLFTPAAVPASYLQAPRSAFPGFDAAAAAAAMSYPYGGLPARGGLFAPPSMGFNPSLSSHLMMGLPGQFGSQEALLSANQEMLNRMQQELNARFLQDRSALPLGLPPVPFTLHTEMHQHQHLHHHQHVLPPGTYLPSAPPQTTGSLFTNPIGMKLPTNNDLLIHSQNLTELAERERLAKQMSGLAGFSGLGVPPGLSAAMPFGQGLHAGAFQPKAGAGNISNLTPASQLLLSLREQENMTRNSALSSATKKRGRWCAAHVQVAYRIQHDKQNRLLDQRISLDQNKSSSERLLGMAAAAAAGGGGGQGPGLPPGHSGILGPPGVMFPRPPSYASLSEMNNLNNLAAFGGLARAGFDVNLFGARLAVNPGLIPSGDGRLPRSSPLSTLRRSPAPPVGQKQDARSDLRRDVSESRDRHSASHHGSRHDSSLSRESRDHRGAPSHSVSHHSRSPDRSSNHHNHSRSRSPHQQRPQQPPMRPPTRQDNNNAREADLRLSQRLPFLPGGDMSMLPDMSGLRNGFQSGPIPGHAFTSLAMFGKPPSAGSSLSSLATIDLERETRKLQFQQQERDRLSSLVSVGNLGMLPHFLGGAANCDAALFRERLINEHERNMMFAAAEFDSRAMRPPDPSLRPPLGGLYQSPADSLLAGASLAQSALLRPNIGRPGLPLTAAGLKLPPNFGPVLDASLLDPSMSLNLPFR